MTSDTGLDGGAPAAEAERLRGMLAAATARLTQTAARLSDAQAREDSGLPGWSRGHVLAHLARNADSLRNLLVWARTGTETPQYASASERAEGIEAGAGLPVATLLADLDASAAALDAEAAMLPDEAWAARVRGGPGGRGNDHPAWYTLWRRLTEVEFHHVDLRAGYEPAQWPEAFATCALQQVAAAFAGPHSPAVVLRAVDVPVLAQIGPPGAPDPLITVTGDVRPLVAWLAGRSARTGLAVGPAGPLPELPPL